jgi:FAD:protein FMN transferase
MSSIDASTGLPAGPRRPDRREFIALGIGAFVVAALPLAARRAPRLVRRTVPAMGTTADLTVVHADERYAQGAIDAALREIAHVERLMTRFRTDSDVGRINSGPVRTRVPVDAATAGVLLACIRWAEASDGRFDPCLGRAVELWDVASRETPPPAPEARRFAGRRLYRSLDVEAGAVVLHEPDVAVDLGAIAKGFAVDRAVAVLRDWGIAHALVNAGGDLHALGNAPDGEAWNVGIRDPHGSGRLAGTIRVADAAVATSGSYEQYFMHEGTRYHHLLDPATGAPQQGTMHSVTIIAECCMTADAAATAVFGAERDSAERILRSGGGGARIVRIG